ncbi:50S ribosomal protein L27 [Candidatus Daviesbacteria bacterium]|nr:50S ribosomal protein L27 [Candidatus Daviesbacteria bacterium]
MAHKKAGSSAKTNKDSNSKRLGIKKYGGEKVIPGNIIVRQKGSKVYAGEGSRFGNDYTIYAITTGKVAFKRRLGKLTVNVVNNG